MRFARLQFSFCRNPFALLLAVSLCVGCTGRNGHDAPPRPVRTFRVGDQAVMAPEEFAGEVRPRRETVLSFRVAGKVAVRMVEAGSQVRKGQLLARLDAADYRLAVQSLNSQLVSARAERDFARNDLQRYRELLDDHLISPPELDRHETAYTAARERVTALGAQLGQAKNQLAYTELLAERDGAITAFEVEAGDVVGAGQPIARLAQLDEKDVAIDIPEQRIGAIRPGLEVRVGLWSHAGVKLRGQVREVAAAADPLTRTFRVRVALLEGHDDARLGMTATVSVPFAPAAGSTIPLSAIFSPKSAPQQPRVWLVNPQSESVRSVAVTVHRAVVGERVEVSGLEPGQIIVSAGVQRLMEGQKVRLPKEAVPESQAEARQP